MPVLFNFRFQTNDMKGILYVVFCLAGFIVSIAVGTVIEKLTSLKVDFNVGWFGYSLLISIVSGAMGALYPALRAANQDPVKALGYE